VSRRTALQYGIELLIAEVSNAKRLLASNPLMLPDSTEPRDSIVAPANTSRAQLA